MPGIDWTAFTWEAFATLTTGISAVVAAFYIGRRQVAISDRQAEVAAKQTEILARQGLLAELTLKHELFDRRMAVYQALANYLLALAMEGRPPTGEVHAEFFRAIATAHFLFSLEANERLATLEEKAREYIGIMTAMRVTIERGRCYTEDQLDTERKLSRWLLERYASLRDIFGNEISLVEP